METSKGRVITSYSIHYTKLYEVDYSAMTEAMNGDIGYRVATYFRSAWIV